MANGLRRSQSCDDRNLPICGRQGIRADALLRGSSPGDGRSIPGEEAAGRPVVG